MKLVLPDHHFSTLTLFFDDGLEWIAECPTYPSHDADDEKKQCVHGLQANPAAPFFL